MTFFRMKLNTINILGIHYASKLSTIICYSDNIIAIMTLKII